MNSDSHVDTVQELTARIRELFHLLGNWAGAIHAEAGVTAAERAVMETLDSNSPASVPDIARRKRVSRQHIQTLADQLIARGLAELRPNPRHRRSKLLALTTDGERLFEAMKRREAPLWQKLADAIDPQAARSANETLAGMRSHIETAIGKGEER